LVCVKKLQYTPPPAGYLYKFEEQGTYALALELIYTMSLNIADAQYMARTKIA
jgi:hypothetical protein